MTIEITTEKKKKKKKEFLELLRFNFLKNDDFFCKQKYENFSFLPISLII